MSPKSQLDLMTIRPYLPAAQVAISVDELVDEEQDEVLAFLAERPVHTVCMAGFIRDNGLVSPHNRGTFYGCRNSEGRLEGVALIGHATFLDARTHRARREFARVAQASSGSHVILGEQEAVEQFWDLYQDEGQPMRLVCRELLFEMRHPVQCSGEVQLRPATPADIDLIVPIHAALAFEESGVDPLLTDAEGFRRRCLRRIEKRRTWVLIKNEQLIFKAEIVADTPDVIYLEGIYVTPAERGKTTGRRCLFQMCRDLLSRAKSICVLVNEKNQRAQSFYRMCNFRLRGHYDTIFLAKGDGQVASTA